MWRAICALLVAGCGGRLVGDSPLDGGVPCDASCTAPVVIAGPVPLANVLGASSIDSVDIVTSECGYQVIVQSGKTITTQALSVSAGQLVAGAATIAATDVDGFMQAGTAKSVAFYVRSATAYTFSGPAFLQPTKLAIPTAMPDLLLQSYASHGSRMLLLFSSASTQAPLWWELTTNGEVTQPLTEAHAPNGSFELSAHAVEYSDGFAWVENDGSSSQVAFSNAPGALFIRPVSVQQLYLADAIWMWPYAPRAVAMFSTPSSGIVLSDDGSVLHNISENMPPTMSGLFGNRFQKVGSSAQLGLVGAIRGAFTIVDSAGVGSGGAAYDPGPELQGHNVQPAPRVAVNGAQAVIVNYAGNVVAIGCH